MSILESFQFIADHPEARYLIEGDSVATTAQPLGDLEEYQENGFLLRVFEGIRHLETERKQRVWVKIDGVTRSVGYFFNKFPRFKERFGADFPEDKFPIETPNLVSVQVGERTFDNVDLVKLTQASSTVQNMIEDCDESIDLVPLHMLSGYSDKLIKVFLSWVAGFEPEDLSCSDWFFLLQVASAVDAKEILDSCIEIIEELRVSVEFFTALSRLPSELIYMVTKEKTIPIFGYSSSEEFVEKFPNHASIQRVDLSALVELPEHENLEDWAKLFPNAFEVTLPGSHNVGDLINLRHFPKLSVLNLNPFPYIRDIASFETLSSQLSHGQMAAVFNLGLVDLAIFSSLEQFREKVPYHESITRVDFRSLPQNDDLGDETLADWAPLFPNGVELFMPSTTEDTDLPILQFFPKLTYLHLEKCSYLTEAGFSELRHTPNLDTIDLSDSRSIEYAGLRHATGLKTLYLDGTATEEAHISPLGIEQVTTLKCLHLSESVFNYLDGIEQLNLKSLYLHSMDSLSEIEEINRNLALVPQSVEILGVSGNSWDDEDVRSFLAQRLPNCRIV